MNFSNRTIKGLFDTSQKSFVIPVYQRAYSWDKEQWKALLDDLREQIHGSNTYFFGNILLETITEDVEYEIIDGQQRLTTISIFLRSIIMVLKERQKAGDKLEFKISEKERLYFKDGGNKKLRPISYDAPCFDALIINGQSAFETASISQMKIKDARIYFIKELQLEETTILLKILNKVETTQITTIELQGKKEAALMFELQNNRGKDLTNMERLKSYFMYQMYVYSIPTETNSNIEEISNIFKLIYGLINDIKSLNEDSILIYHCNAFVKGFPYRTLEDIKEVFKKSVNKVFWILHFIQELHTTFSNMKKLELCRDNYLQNLRKLNIPAFVYPFLIKGYKYFGDDNEKMSRLFHVMEVLVFRYYLMSSRADIIARLNEVLLGFQGDLDMLSTTFKRKLNETGYWGDERTSKVLNEWMYENPVLNYLLWSYEASIQSKGYVVGIMKLTNEQIEHISPQIPNDEYLTSGYEVDENNNYTQEFIQDYLNCLGNLLLISGSHNASIGNKPFKNKFKSYNENPLLNQQGEIKSFISGTNENPLWDVASISRRHKILHTYAINAWNFDIVL
ncbi:MAG: DUF262 domain-containing HNH endonuclease family protein [Saprospiraceae bacterium]